MGLIPVWMRGRKVKEEEKKEIKYAVDGCGAVRVREAH